MRLDKYLADARIGTRSEVKKLIQKKRVCVNGQPVADAGYRLSVEDEVLCDGQPVGKKSPRYFMLHKPAGCVSATKDAGRTVLDCFGDEADGLFPVGRLDKDTEGLLLLTDDGVFSHSLISPRRHVAKTYYFEGVGSLAADAKERVKEGLDIGDAKPTLPGELVLENDFINQPEPSESSICSAEADGGAFVKGTLTIYEGRYHQVKRMLHVLGVEITYLKRLSIGGLCLDEGLGPGEYRSLTAAELSLLCGAGK